jgi:hypothetical protein
VSTPQIYLPFNPGDSNPFTPGTTPPGFPSTPPWLPPPVGPDTNYAPQDPGDYAAPPQPTVPPVAPGAGASPGQPGSQPGTFYDTASGWLGVGVGSIFGSRRYKPSRFQKELIAAARRVGLSAVRGAASAFGTFERVATETTALVPYEAGMGFLGAARDVARRSLYGIGIATAIDAMFPPSLSDTDQFPLPLKILAQGPMARTVREMVYRDEFKRARRTPNDAVQQLLQRGPDVILGERPPTLVEKFDRLAPDLGIGRILNPSGWTPFRTAPNATVITATAPGFNDYVPPPDVTPGDLAKIAAIGPPVTSTSSSTSSSSSPSSGPRAGKGGTLPPGHIRWGVIGVGLGAIVGANFILPRVFGSSSSSGFVAPGVPTPATAPQPTVTVQPSGNVAPQYFGGDSFGGGNYCEPRPRGPRRKCLERAPVAWRAGRNKGKAAGSKCVRYAQRKT